MARPPVSASRPSVRARERGREAEPAPRRAAPKVRRQPARRGLGGPGPSNSRSGVSGDVIDEKGAPLQEQLTALEVTQRFAELLDRGDLGRSYAEQLLGFVLLESLRPPPETQGAVETYYRKCRHLRDLGLLSMGRYIEPVAIALGDSAPTPRKVARRRPVSEALRPRASGSS